MKILGFQSGHDVSYCLLDNGIPVLHEELERFIRKKEPEGDGLKFAFSSLPKEIADDIGYFSLGNYGVWSDKALKAWGPEGTELAKYDAESCYNQDAVDKMESLIQKNTGGFYQVSHHQSHAANAFYTSNFERALIVTMDGGGWESDTLSTAFTISLGEGNKITTLRVFEPARINLGQLWSRMTGKVYGLSTGYPYGKQMGTVMAMATMGNPTYVSEIHPAGDLMDYEKLKKIADSSEQEAFNIAASLQAATEQVIFQTINPYVTHYGTENICFSGGVSLNCVALGKLATYNPQLNIFCDPVPYDGGLSIGSARYVWHHILNNPRIYDNPKNQSSYLGRKYANDSSFEEVLNKYDNLEIKETNDDEVLKLLDEGNIISVFGGGSESGRRALGNRSILADPRDPNMKKTLNAKVKHRQWYRPFAPSILREEVKNYFKVDVSSPYMSLAVEFKDDVKDKVPAVLHFDNTGRLQTVTEDQNEWYYNFIKKWHKLSGVPILLNTSFNDREPIVETPENAINCFLGTNIDYLYFFEFGLLLKKK